MPENANDNPRSGLAGFVPMLCCNGVAAAPQQISHRLGGAAIDMSEIVRCARSLLSARRLNSNHKHRLKT